MTADTPALAAPERDPLGPSSDPVGGLVSLVWLSLLVNLLFLTGPIFMMQVYDRVLPSGNASTLVALLMIAGIGYVAFGAFDLLRSQIASLRGAEIAERYAGDAANVALRASVSGEAGDRRYAVEDVEQVRSFLTSPSVVALFDLPSMPLFLVGITLLHPVLGVTAIIAALLLAAIAVFNERTSRALLEESQRCARIASQQFDDFKADATGLAGNGALDQSSSAWRRLNEVAGATSLAATRRLGGFTSITKTLRLAIQSVVLGVGAYLAINGELSAGAIIAASVVFARAIAPIEQTLTAYRSLLGARKAWARIRDWSGEHETAASVILPEPTRNVSLTAVSIAAPGSDREIVRDVTVALEAGDILGVVGTSGAGKSTLSKALCGAWPVQSGRIELDGADLHQWTENARQGFIGYLGQTVRLVDGTIAENISRFATDIDSEAVIAAARAADVHDLILTFPNGYETEVGTGGIKLSGGQRQRLGLARALYHAPFLLVLDEPAAHLDQGGHDALLACLNDRTSRGQITVLTSHQSTLVDRADKLLILDNGRMTISGPRQAVRDHLAGLGPSNEAAE